ncbi:hypothetical protein BGW39_011289 [Mortierella sp. 14UC]|nr:hypothetical protein BGW39_011289 [Mortierella sp. 14UC]
MDDGFDWPLLRSPDMAVVNRATTLNIFPLRTESYETRRLPLREILCKFEHLVHLRAPTAAYFVEDMDFHDVQEQLRAYWNRTNHAYRPGRIKSRIRTDDPAEARQYVWACRRLKTLQLTVDYSNRGGYIVRRAIVAAVWVPEQDVPATSGAGYEDMDIEHEATKRTVALDRLKHPLLQRQTFKPHRKRFRVLPLPEVAAAGSKLVERDRELGMDLSKVGYPEDLQEWMDDYFRADSAATFANNKGVHYSLPKLQSFWIEYRHENRQGATREMNKYLAKVRPNVDFKMSECDKDVFYYTTLEHY